MFQSLAEFKKLNKKVNHNYFSEGNKIFFSSIIHTDLLHGKLFVESTQFDFKSPRLFHITECLQDGTTQRYKNTSFQQFKSLQSALDFIEESENPEKWIDANKEVPDNDRTVIVKGYYLLLHPGCEPSDLTIITNAYYENDKWNHNSHFDFEVLEWKETKSKEYNFWDKIQELRDNKKIQLKDLETHIIDDPNYSYSPFHPNRSSIMEVYSWSVKLPNRKKFVTFKSYDPTTLMIKMYNYIKKSCPDLF